MASKLFEHASAVRGFHYFRKYWQPTPNQVLECSHEKENPYDFFAIKACDIDRGTTVGHLPMGNSRALKFLIDRGATSQSCFNFNELLCFTACSGWIGNPLSRGCLQRKRTNR